MCRLLAYLGAAIAPHQLLFTPEHSLVAQSYQPREMTAGLLNADGFGLGWYDNRRQPYSYKNTQPIWSDINLPGLSRYIQSGCFLANIRSATPGQAINLSNCQPFAWQHLLGVHNGYIENFHQTLYRPLRHLLPDHLYQGIGGTTDSEHIFAILLDFWQEHQDLTSALRQTLKQLIDLASSASTSANLILADGQQLVACRFATRSPAPSLYWLEQDPGCPRGVILASEPLFTGHWQTVPESSILQVGPDLAVHLQPI